MAVACFQLRHQSASFEYFLWLVLAQAMGATKIVIDRDDMKLKWFSREATQARIDKILLPGAAFAGLYSKIGHYSSGMITTRAPDLFQWVRSGGTFRRLQSVKSPGSARYTVTLRRQVGAPGRNSNEPAWRQFAEEIGATVIEEYAVRPIDLHDRMALYAGAEMNFGVCNGPIAMISLSEYPVMMFVPKGPSASSMVKAGVSLGGRFPWMLPNQRTVWRQDNLEDMRQVFAELHT